MKVSLIKNNCMKSLSQFFILSIFLSVLFCFTQCKKDKGPLNITLYDKPLSTIQNYIQGKWKCHYGKGGIAANNIQYYNNLFWIITTTSKIQISNNGNITTDTTINWIKDVAPYTNGDSTFIMSFFDKLGYPANYVVDKIINDTLILHETAVDAVFYHFTKSN